MEDDDDVFSNSAMPVNLTQNVTVEEDLQRQFAYRIQMYRLVIPFFLFLACLAVLANTIIVVALSSSRVRNATITLIMSLTASDIWTSSVLALSLLYNSYLPIVLGTDVQACFALTLEIFRTGGLLTSTLHLLVISIYHYIGIVHPHFDHVRLRRVAVSLCLLAWLGPLMALVFLALSFSGQGYWNCENVHFYHSRYFRFSVSALLLAIFVLITTCYARLVCILRLQRERWRQNNGPPAMEKQRRREKRTLWTTVLICSSFFVGWAPATVVFTLTCDTCELLREQRFRTVFILSCAQLSFILGKSLLNPLIYSIRIPEVDAQIRRRLAKKPFAKFFGGANIIKKKHPSYGGYEQYPTSSATTLMLRNNNRDYCRGKFDNHPRPQEYEVCV